MIRASRLEVKSTEGRTLLHPFDLEVEAKTVLGVFGPNGSGKSSMLRAIAGEPGVVSRLGEVLIEGVPVRLLSNARDRSRRILYLGSDFRSPFELTVRDLFELGLEAASGRLWPGISTSERERMSSVVEALELISYLPRFFQTLSDGEKQYVMFARALIQAPKVLILDETFSKLDLDRLIAVTRIIRSWCECGMTFVISSHDLNFLSEISDQLVFLKQGRALAGGPVDSVLNETNLRDLFSKVAPHVITSPESGKRKILY